MKQNTMLCACDEHVQQLQIRAEGSIDLQAENAIHCCNLKIKICWHQIYRESQCAESYFVMAMMYWLAELLPLKTHINGGVRSNCQPLPKHQGANSLPIVEGAWLLPQNIMQYQCLCVFSLDGQSLGVCRPCSPSIYGPTGPCPSWLCTIAASNVALEMCWRSREWAQPGAQIGTAHAGRVVHAKVSSITCKSW